MRRAAAFVAGIAAVGALALPAVSGADSPIELGKKATVTVNDDYYSPTDLQIKKDTEVNFKWNSSNTNTHNVVLKKGPKGVKKGCPTKGKDAYSDLISKCNKSGSGAIGIKFKKKFDVKGTYNFYCTIHPDLMKVNIKVK